MIGQDPQNLPHSGGHMQSAIGKELSDDSPYTKSHAERTKSPESSSDDKV